MWENGLGAHSNAGTPGVPGVIGWCIVYYKKEGFVRWFAVLEVGFAFGVVVASLGRDLLLGWSLVLEGDFDSEFLNGWVLL